MNRLLKYDKIIALFFLILTVVFFYAMSYQPFFYWAFERHQNQLSWYIRPLFIIPFCFFAYKHSWAGVFFTLFLLFTSMFWFPKPDSVSNEVLAFLHFEMEWLYGDWNVTKASIMLMAPVSLFILGLACWKRSLLMALAVVVLMATGKIVWSYYHAGNAGLSIILPAIAGLLVCIILIIIGYRRIEIKNRAIKG